MKSLVRVADHLMDLLGAIKEQGGEITPDQERALAEIPVEDIGRRIYELQVRVAQAKALEEKVRAFRKELEVEADLLRPVACEIVKELQGGAPKPKPVPVDDLATMTTAWGRGSIELAPGCTEQDVDPMYVTQKVVFSIDKDAAREEFEAGRDVQGLVFTREKHLVLKQTERGKQVALESEATRLLA